MTTKSIKFELSFEKFSVKFEGDIQTAERLQGEITNAIGTLASTQRKILSPGQAPAVQVLDDPRRRRRGRRKTVVPNGIDAAVLEGEATEVETDGETRSARRSSSGGRAGLLTQLKDEGFFGQKRTIADMRDALATKGHTVKSNEISPVLVGMTRANTLKREKNAEGQWVYFA